MTTRFTALFPYLLITLLCVGAVELFYLGVERYLLEPAVQSDEEVQDTAQSVEPPIETLRQPEDYSAVTGRNLFGPPPKAAADQKDAAASVAQELEATTLEIVLMGTINSGEEQSRAIILNKSDGKQEMYRVGDTVQGGTIKEILRGKVILTVDGRDEMLDMSEARQYAQQAAPPPVRRPALRRPNATTSRFIRPGLNRQGQVVAPRVVRPARRIVSPRADEDQSLQASQEVPPVEELEQDAADVPEDAADTEATVQQPEEAPQGEEAQQAGSGQDETGQETEQQ